MARECMARLCRLCRPLHYPTSKISAICYVRDVYGTGVCCDRFRWPMHIITLSIACRVSCTVNISKAHTQHFGHSVSGARSLQHSKWPIIIWTCPSGTTSNALKNRLKIYHKQHSSPSRIKANYSHFMLQSPANIRCRRGSPYAGKFGENSVGGRGRVGDEIDVDGNFYLPSFDRRLSSLLVGLIEFCVCMILFMSVFVSMWVRLFVLCQRRPRLHSFGVSKNMSDRKCLFIRHSAFTEMIIIIIKLIYHGLIDVDYLHFAAVSVHRMAFALLRIVSCGCVKITSIDIFEFKIIHSIRKANSTFHIVVFRLKIPEIRGRRANTPQCWIAAAAQHSMSITIIGRMCLPTTRTRFQAQVCLPTLTNVKRGNN